MKLNENSTNSDQFNWKQDLQTANQDMQQNLNDKSIPNSIRTEMLNLIKINDYRMDNDLNPYESTIWSKMIIQAPGIILIVILFTIIVAADTIAAEFSWGTIKLLLIQPVSRTKILYTKYLATLIFAISLLVVSFITMFLLGCITEGFGGIGQVDVYIGLEGTVEERSVIGNVLQIYSLYIIELIMYITFAFMISAIFRSSSMAIAFSMILLLIGDMAMGFLDRYEWTKYTLFENIHLSSYKFGAPLRPDMSLEFSIVVLTVYFVIFHLLTWLLFLKRDVTA